jgi:3-hydroxyisobutyrate dehydrogenase
MRIGFIGLGNMGRHMARHLIKAGVLITMLPTPRIVEDVMLSGGAGAALAPGAIWVDMSSSTPAAARRIAESVLDPRGVRRLDAPVSGMARGAEAGTLQIFAGGAVEDFQDALPLFEVLGDPERIQHVGAAGH